MESFVEIIDVATLKTRTVLVTPRHVEAPNWTPDGQALMVNADGRLFRIDLENPALVAIDTGTCFEMNNDHGPSPDGTLMAISDKAETGKSCIYVVPTTGGTPRRITQKVPSWFHGWSPDGQCVTYPCVRDGQFGIATCTLAGVETVLISGPGHYDGPDFTPDGDWIWFNSDRGGDMALWRMRADGSAAQQMTEGDRVDWFPHPSPDGRNLCYLSYPPGTIGHPFGSHVELRLMPVAGGSPTTLHRIFGGQGCLNVPSWSPDGRQFAYVRYSETDL